MRFGEYTRVNIVREVLNPLLLSPEIGLANLPKIWMLQDPSTLSVVDLVGEVTSCDKHYYPSTLPKLPVNNQQSMHSCTYLVLLLKTSQTQASQLPCFTSRCTVLFHQFGLIDILYRVPWFRSTMMTWSPMPVKHFKGCVAQQPAAAGLVLWCIETSALGVKHPLVCRLELIAIE